MKHKLNLVFLFSAIVALAGCAVDVFWLPERDATVLEAFPNYTPPSDPEIARQAVVQQLFDAPYEDVFRAVNVSTSQALFHVHEQNKRAGVVLATEVLRASPTDRVHTTFYYAILIKERGPRQTSVTVMAKVQYPCRYQVSGAGIHIATFGLQSAVESGGKEFCTRTTAVQWAAAVSNSGISHPFSPNHTPEIMRFLSFIRNNLIAAGAL